MIVNGKLWLATLLAAATFSSAYAQASRTDSSRGYATDTFEGFEASDKEEGLPQKEKSFWYSLSEKTPEAQLGYAH